MKFICKICDYECCKNYAGTHLNMKHNMNTKKYIITSFSEYLNESYNYYYSCVNPTSYDELMFIIDNMKEITPKTFFNNVNYNDDVVSKKELLNDYHVRYYRCKKGKIDCYVLKHSAIEYIFKSDDIKSDIKPIKKIEEPANYELLKSYKNFKIGDYIDNYGKITNIFHYLDDDTYQFEFNRKTYINYKWLT